MAAVSVCTAPTAVNVSTPSAEASPTPTPSSSLLFNSERKRNQDNVPPSIAMAMDMSPSPPSTLSNKSSMVSTSIQQSKSNVHSHGHDPSIDCHLHIVDDHETDANDDRERERNSATPPTSSCTNDMAIRTLDMNDPSSSCHAHSHSPLIQSLLHLSSSTSSSTSTSTSTLTSEKTKRKSRQSKSKSLSPSYSPRRSPRRARSLPRRSPRRRSKSSSTSSSTSAKMEEHSHQHHATSNKAKVKSNKSPINVINTSPYLFGTSYQANDPCEDRYATLTNVLLKPQMQIQMQTQTQDENQDQCPSSLSNNDNSNNNNGNNPSAFLRMSLFAVLDGHGGPAVADFASKKLLPLLTENMSQAFKAEIVHKGDFQVNGHALIDLNSMSIGNGNGNGNHGHAEDDDDDDDDDDISDSEDEQGEAACATTTGGSPKYSYPSIHTSIPNRHNWYKAPDSDVPSPSLSLSSSSNTFKEDNHNHTPPPPIILGGNSTMEQEKITHIIQNTFLQLDEMWMNDIDPLCATTRQTFLVHNGKWNSGACCLVNVVLQRVEVESALEDGDDNNNDDDDDATVNMQEEKKEELLQEENENNTTTETRNKLRVYPAVLYSAHTGDCRSVLLKGQDDHDNDDDDDESHSEFSSRNGSPYSSEHDSDSDSDDDDDDSENEIDRCCFVNGAAYASCLNGSRGVRKNGLLLDPSSLSSRNMYGRGAGIGGGPTTNTSTRLLNPFNTVGNALKRRRIWNNTSLHLLSSDEACDDDHYEEKEILGMEHDSATTATTTTSSSRRKRSRPRSMPASPDAIMGDGSLPQTSSSSSCSPLPKLSMLRNVTEEQVFDNTTLLRRRMRRSSSVSTSTSTSTISSSCASSVSPMPSPLPERLCALTLTADHTPYNEKEASLVRARCGYAPRAITSSTSGGIQRVAGSLAVTRALGDAYLKTPKLSFMPYKKYAPYITALPEVSTRLLQDGDRMLVLASDGVWERVTGDKVAVWVSSYYQKRNRNLNRRGGGVISPLLDACASTSSPNSPVQDHGCLGLGLGSMQQQQLHKPTLSRRMRMLPTRKSLNTVKKQEANVEKILQKVQVSDMIVSNVLNRVRRKHKMQNLRTLMALPKGHARRSRHDDITTVVVDLEGFVL